MDEAQGGVQPRPKDNAAGETNTATAQNQAPSNADNVAPAAPTQTTRVDRAARVKGDIEAIDPATLTNEQKLVREVYLGQTPEAELRLNDISDIATFSYGSKRHGARKILLRHGGTDVAGGLTPQEMLDIGEVVRRGRLAADSFTETANSIRYAYDFTDADGVKFRVIVEELNDGKKLIDLYSDRNIPKTAAEPVAIPPHSATDETIPQNPAKSQEPIAAQPPQERTTPPITPQSDIDGFISSINPEFRRGKVRNYFGQKIIT
ncbi:MAG: hypothetical protein LBQ52_03100, partial [Helicobacteraceae bacterium]|nr:hypothetical protein [Helicobacteraceae bacterium]